MNDFLKNLRSSNKKETSDPKKKLDGHYYPQNDRRKIQDRRPNSSEVLDIFLTCLTDILPKLNENASLLAHHFEKIVCANDLLNEAKIRRHNAVSNFLDNLNQLFKTEFSNAEGKNFKATTSYASGTHYTKDQILSIIKSMRKNEATFAAIADYLKGKGIPTFSGRGEWHAQTVHRLCK
ncbi:MAG: hypothetical protein A3J80_04235 [Desulfobacula sp. RIFOXYB2_FULL_45_6]|jgi:hypothetical protein|nr:MAG: hypothetical protein A3J80_04235 [Desulfobacula sp. RIFOXYB2_FULL_45_6]